MASGPITSWQIDGDMVETVADFIFGAPKSLQMVTAAIKLRCLFLRRKAMTNLDSLLKTRGITLPTNVHLVKAMVFPVVRYGCESWTVKKAEHRRIDAFELWCWRRLLRVPWTARRSNHSLKASILQYSAFFIVQLSDLNIITGKTTAFTIRTFVSKVMSLLFNMLSRFVIAFLLRSRLLLIHGCSHHLQ